MAYKALYRTYRPNSFDEVAGQNHIVQTLQHAVERNKIAHAYLFCGPRGTGKTSIAKIFAKTINCTDETHKPCLTCENCLAVKDGSHPDIIEIDAASNNGVEEVRSLIEKVKYAPLKGKYKVYIIDEVHMMSTGAFNALLKTIEEPPAHVIFILATTEPHKVLPTIISRCQRFDFTKVAKNEIINRIHTVLENEHITCEEEVIRIIAQLADGGLRDALSILDQCIAYAQNDIKEHHINEIYGITTISEKLEMMKNIFDKEPVELMNKVDGLIEKGIDVKRLTVDLIEILKESVMFELTKDSGLLKILDTNETQLFIEKTNIKQRFNMIDILMNTYDKYRSAANASSYFEVCLLQMLSCSDDIEEKVKEKVKTPTVNLFEKKKEIENVSRETFDTVADNELDEIQQESIELNISNPVKDETVLNETNQITEKQSKSANPLDDELVLGLLAGANKPERAEDFESFKKINDFMMDFNWAKLASLIRNSEIVASSKTYIILSVDNQAEANNINEADSKNELSAFLIELLGKNKKVFAIAKNHQQRIIKEFKDRMIAGTLPEPANIETVEIKQKENREPTQEEAVLNLFGEENIIITEE